MCVRVSVCVGVSVCVLKSECRAARAMCRHPLKFILHRDCCETSDKNQIRIFRYHLGTFARSALRAKTLAFRFGEQPQSDAYDLRGCRVETAQSWQAPLPEKWLVFYARTREELAFHMEPFLTPTSSSKTKGSFVECSMCLWWCVSCTIHDAEVFVTANAQITSSLKQRFHLSSVSSNH